MRITVTVIPMTKGDRCQLARTIAEYMTAEGTEMTRSGSYIFYFDEINQLFGTSLPDDADMVEKITDALDSDIAADADMTEGFDLVFYLDHCPNAEGPVSDDMPVPQM